MSVPEIGEHRAPLAARGNVAHDRAGLRRAVEHVRAARRRVDLADAVAVEVAHLDLVDEGLVLAVDLLRGEPTLAVGADERDDALVVRAHDDRRDAVPEDVGDLGVAQPREAAPEVGLPQHLRLGSRAPQLERGRAAAHAQEAAVPARRAVLEQLVEDVALGVGQRPVAPGLPAGGEECRPWPGPGPGGRRRPSRRPRGRERALGLAREPGGSPPGRAWNRGRARRRRHGA